MTLMQKVTLWFTVLLLVLAVPPTGRERSAAGAQLLAGAQQVVWASSTFASSRYLTRLGNSGVPGARATSTIGGRVAKGPGPSKDHSLDPAGLCTPVLLPAENLEVVAEIQANPPAFPAAARSTWVPCARDPPVKFTRLS
jgi:hypothetical protein